MKSEDLRCSKRVGDSVPTMKVRVPAEEPIGPPDMGASTKFGGFGSVAKAWATDLMESTARVPHSIKVLRFEELSRVLMPASTPVVGSRYTASRADSEGRTVRRVS